MLVIVIKFILNGFCFVDVAWAQCKDMSLWFLTVFVDLIDIPLQDNLIQRNAHGAQ